MANAADLTGIREARATIRYLDEGEFVTRRYVSQGAEINTGDYRDYPVLVRDGMPIRDRFALDSHGFMIARCPTKVRNFNDNAEVDAVYEREVADAVKTLTGASFVAVQGWMRRTTADLSAKGGRVSAQGRVAAAGGRGPYRLQPAHWSRGRRAPLCSAPTRWCGVFTPLLLLVVAHLVASAAGLAAGSDGWPHDRRRRTGVKHAVRGR